MPLPLKNISHRTPFFYGWVIFAIASALSVVRPVMAVATLSVFLVPMTREFGWSRGFFSAAVGIGGLAGAVISPFAGRLLDRYGAGYVLAAGSLITGACAFALSFVVGPISFALVYILGRMTYVGPMELAPSTAVSNWFIRKRAFTLALIQASQGAGLGLMPFIAQIAINGWGWRSSWVVLAAVILAVGVIPPLLLMIRRPEDVGLLPDGETSAPGTSPGAVARGAPERDFTLAQASRTPAMWMLMAFSALMFMVQAGVSLHQAPYYINKGLSPTQAATIVTVFALSTAVGGLLWSALVSKVSLRFVVTAAAFCQFAGVLVILRSDGALSGYAAAVVFGGGLGGVAALLRLVWADYYGRRHLGAIRGMALPAQVGGQALGPVLAGVLFDITDAYTIPLVIFAVSAAVGAVLVSLTKPPRLPSEG